MKTTFVYSALAACALHAVLLFGFNSRDPVPLDRKPSEPVDALPPIPFVLREPDPVEPEAGGGASGPSVPQSPEVPLPPRPDAITVAIERPTREPARVVLDAIPKPGVRDGGDFESLSSLPPGPVAGGPLPAGLLDAPPRSRSQVPPTYPFESKRNGTTGEVVVAFNVDENGKVFSPRIVKSTSREFEEATLRAVEKWTFQPGTKDGKRIRFSMIVPVLFNMTAD